MSITTLYSFDITKRKKISEINKNGLLETVQNYFLHEKKLNIVLETDVLANDLNGEFSEKEQVPINFPKKLVP